MRVLVINDKGEPSPLRSVGWWSHPTKDFEHIDFVNYRSFQGRLDVVKMPYDLVIWEDSAMRLRMRNSGPATLCFVVVDSTLSESHRTARLHTIRGHKDVIDFILVDHDKLSVFKEFQLDTVRFAHAVNTGLYRDRGHERHIDVSFHCRTKHSEPRSALQLALKAHCEQKGYVYSLGTQPLQDYASNLSHSKITVNLSRTPINRPHRIFDAMASGACVLTNPLPRVSGDDLLPGVHYVEWYTNSELFDRIDDLLETGEWSEYAKAGHRQVVGNHTWGLRAEQVAKTVRVVRGKAT